MNADKPTERKTNALAELAERLEVEAKFAQENGRNGRPIYNASRIVAELAKVRFNRHEVFGEYANGDDLIKAMNNCRAIAEEGGE